MRPYRGRIMLLALIAVTEIGLGVLAPWPLKLVIDNVLGSEPMLPEVERVARLLTGNSKAELLFVVVIGGLLLQLLSQVISTVNTQVQVDTGQRMVYTLRARLLAHLQALALRHHILTRTADSVYRLEADAYCVHDLVMSGVFPLVTSVLTLTAMFIILVRLDPSLALLSLTVIPFLYACLRYYSKRMVDRAERVKELESKLVERLYEILSSIKVVKGFAREPHELQRFKSAGHETMSARLKYTWQESLFTLAVTANTLIGTALVFACAAVIVPAVLFVVVAAVGAFT
jgi:ATP-binding cassette subfamily B protein/subfamily B ATP-binding cassette protein MsbA